MADTVPVKRTFSVSASVTAADGTPIRWRTSKGRITASSRTVQSGVASATVEVTPETTGEEADGFDGTAVVTAAVAKSTAIASVDLGGISFNAQAPALQPGADPSPVEVSAPQLAGQAVLITPVVSLQQQVQSFDAAALQAASGSLATAPHLAGSLAYGSLRVDVVVQQPAERAVVGALLQEPGVYSLELNADGQPVLKVQTNAGEDSVTLSDPAAAVLAGDTTTVSLAITSTTARVSAGSSTAVVSLRGPPQVGGGTPVNVPSASLPCLHSASFSWQQPAAGGSVLLSGLANGTLTLDASGHGTFQAALPAGFNGTSVRLMVSPADAGSTVPPAQHSLPAAQDNIVGPQLPAVLDEVVALHVGASFENRPAGATMQEQTELARYAASSAVNAQKAAYQTGLDKLAPLENGGVLPHQAQQGKKYLEMAAKLDAAAAEIEKMVAATSAVTVTDETGKQLFSMDIADQVQQKVASAGRGAWNWVRTNLQPLATTLERVKDYAGESVDNVVTAAGESLGALVTSVKSTETWRHAQIIAREMDNIPLLCDAKKLVTNLTDEGLVEYLKALWRFAKLVGKNPQAAAMYGFAQLEDVIKGPLNDWARAEGDGTQVAVAAAGLLAYAVQTGVMVASTACDVGAAKRMISQMLGTVLSAAFGNQKAKDELKEMVPFYSWLMMGEQIADLWTGKKEDGSNATDDGLPDYYGAGKKAGELIVQVIGDVTIIFPVVKGASMALKAGNKVSAVLVQALKKTGSAFVREVNPLEGLRHLDDLPKMCRSSGGCFPAGVCVVMADGTTRPIENIAVGDWVLADQPEDGMPPAPQRVSSVHQNWTEHLTLVTLAFIEGESQSSILKSTNTHPYWVAGRGWIAAWQLHSGDHLLGADGLLRKVVSVKEQKTTCDTWNLTIEDKHSFFVIQDKHSALVHNAGQGPRNYVVYTLEWVENGVTKAYTGKTGALSGGVASTTPQRVFDKRYPGEYVKVRYNNPAYPDTPGAPKTLTKKILKSDLTNIHYREFFHDMNDVPTGITGSNGKPKSQGDLLVEGLEQVHYDADKEKYGSENMYNRKAPSTNAHGQVQRATKYMTDRAGRPCPPR